MHQSVLLHHVWKFEIFFAFFQDFVGDYKEKQKAGGQQRRLKQANPTPFYMPMCLALSENDGNPSNSSATFTKKSPRIPILSKRHNKGRRKTGSFTWPTIYWCRWIAGKASTRVRKKKLIVKKPPRYNINGPKRQSLLELQPGRKSLFLPFRIKNCSLPTSR